VARAGAALASEAAQGGAPAVVDEAADMARTQGAVMQRMLETRAKQAQLMAQMMEESAEQDREMALLAKEFKHVKALGSKTNFEAQAAAPDKKSSACALQ
jgi:hypothetical protein